MASEPAARVMRNLLCDGAEEESVIVYDAQIKGFSCANSRRRLRTLQRTALLYTAIPSRALALRIVTAVRDELLIEASPSGHLCTQLAGKILGLLANLVQFAQQFGVLSRRKNGHERIPLCWNGAKRLQTRVHEGPRCLVSMRCVFSIAAQECSPFNELFLHPHVWPHRSTQAVFGETYGGSAMTRQAVECVRVQRHRGCERDAVGAASRPLNVRRNQRTLSLLDDAALPLAG